MRPLRVTKRQYPLRSEGLGEIGEGPLAYAGIETFYAVGLRQVARRGSKPGTGSQSNVVVGTSRPVQLVVSIVRL